LLKVFILLFPREVETTIEKRLKELGVTLTYVKRIPEGFHAEVLLLPNPPAGRGEE